MSEPSLWSTVSLALGPFFDLVRVENRVGVGTPDVNWAGFAQSGWLELKHLPRWPVRESTPILIPKLTLEQVRWAEAHSVKHRVAMLLRVGGRGGGYGLFGPPAMRAIYERKLPRAGVIRAAGVWAEGAFPAAEVVRWLTRRPPGGVSAGGFVF
jgi:hypothetical protein